MTPREKEVWKQRLTCLQSLSLETIAAEVNDKRWKDYLCILAAPTEAQRKKMRALIHRYEAGSLRELPNDLRANGARMRKVLIALHRLLKSFSDGVFRHDQIAVEAGCSPETCERAIRDLVEADLIIADRKRERPRRYGGQGANRYQFVWSTVVNLAVAQGLQFTLPLAVEEQGRPPASTSSGQACRPQDDREPAAAESTHCEEAPPHREEAPPHREEAPPHKIGPNAHAGASFPHSIHPSSPSAPTEGLRHTPSAEPHSNSATQKEKKDFLSQPTTDGWPAVAGRLERYGVLLPWRALHGARARGWTVAQVVELLDLCEAKSVDQGPRGVARGWVPGLLFRHLQSCPAGAAIAIPLSETYRRAARDRAIQQQQRRQASAEAAQAEQKATSPGRTETAADEGAARELAFGHVLDGMSAEDRLDLARAELNPFALKYFRKFGSMASGVRELLLRALERRAATVNGEL